MRGRVVSLAWMLVKLSVAVGIVWFLLSQGKLDLSLFLEGAIDANIFVVAMLCNFFMISMSAVRWNILLRSQKVVVPFLWAHNMTYLSACFNLFIPGAVGGDAFRMAYVARRVPERKAAVILTVVADRFVGLYGLLSLCLVGMLVSFSAVMAVVPLKLMLFSVVAIVVGGPISLLLFFLLLPRLPWLRSYVDAPPQGKIGHIVHAVVDAMRHFMQAKGLLVLAIVVCVVAQAIEVFAVIWIAMGLDMMTLSPEGFYVATPLAWLANVIPISPGGLGVGEAAFDQLCRWLQPIPTATAFGTIFFINRIFQMLASMPGFLVYIFNNQQTSKTPAPPS